MKTLFMMTTWCTQMPNNMDDCIRALQWLSRLRKTYQPVEGYSDKTTEARRDSYRNILTVITGHCKEVKGKSFLDIGSNVGYFCFELAKLGATATGIEHHQMRVELCRCLARSQMSGCKCISRKLSFIHADAVDWVLENNIKFDYVLLLNTFHHLLMKDEERSWQMFDKLIDGSQGVFVMMRNSLGSWSLCPKRVQIPKSVVERSKAEKSVVYPPINGRNIIFFSK